jgi:outer membrane protein assembly factor BamB
MVRTCLAVATLSLGLSWADAPAAEPITDWPTWGGSPARNMVAPHAARPPIRWDCEAGTNIKWSVRLGGTTYGNPVVSAGRILVGTNNENPRDPAVQGDRGVVMCFSAADGRFLWQDTYVKLPTGQRQDWPLQGICSSPAVAGDCVYYLNNRAQVVCADLEGFHDGQNDGPFQDEEQKSLQSADILWRYDLIAELGVSPRFMAASSPLVVGDRVFVVTSNGVNPESNRLDNPRAPSFVALDGQTGQLLWQQGFAVPPDGLANALKMDPIMEGQWGSPGYAVITGDGQRDEQVYFPGGDGFLYGLRPADGTMLWKCDCNRPGVRWLEGGRGDKGYLLATPVAAEGRVYIAVGHNPEHGGGPGNLVAIDASGRGDVTTTHIRWHRGGKEFGRSISTVAVHQSIVYAADLDGILHALDAASGKELWEHDMLSAVWGSPLVANGMVYLADEDGDVVVLAAGPKLNVLAENRLPDAVYGTPVAVGKTLYVTTRSGLFAIETNDIAEQNDRVLHGQSSSRQDTPARRRSVTLRN